MEYCVNRSKSMHFKRFKKVLNLLKAKELFEITICNPVWGIHLQNRFIWCEDVLKIRLEDKSQLLCHFGFFCFPFTFVFFLSMNGTARSFAWKFRKQTDLLILFLQLESVNARWFCLKAKSSVRLIINLFDANYNSLHYLKTYLFSVLCLNLLTLL